MELLSRHKSFVKIQFGDQIGWVHKLAISNKAPRKRVSLLSGKADIRSKARKRASRFTSAAAARGLTDKNDITLVRRGKPNYLALVKMETYDVREDEAIYFINENEDE